MSDREKTLVEIELRTYSDGEQLEEVELADAGVRAFEVCVAAPKDAPKRTAPRGRTESIKRLAKSTVERGRLENPPVDFPVNRPRTRGECLQGEGAERPCPFVSCKHHLYLDVNPRSGAIKLNFPHLEVWDLPESCTLDLADRGSEAEQGARGHADGAMTLEEIAGAINLTRERVRQIETEGLAKVRELAQLAGLAELVEGDVSRPDLARSEDEGDYGGARAVRAAAKRLLPPIDRSPAHLFARARARDVFVAPTEVREAIDFLCRTRSAARVAELLDVDATTVKKIVRGEMLPRALIDRIEGHEILRRDTW